MSDFLLRNLDERTMVRLKAVAKRHGWSIQEEIKAVLTEAVLDAHVTHVVQQTHGAWKRKESPDQTVNHIKSAFRKSMTPGKGAECVPKSSLWSAFLLHYY